MKLYLVLVLLTALIAELEAYQFYVGGKDGWVITPSENYNHWAGRMRFQVNDTLFFRYKKGTDSVLVVKQGDYDKCNMQNPIIKMDGGDSIFKFDRSGPFFFISGIQDHCDKGQKLIIVVLAVRNKSPPGSPAPVAQAPAPKMEHVSPAPGPIALGPAPEMGHVSPAPGPIALGPAPEMGHASPTPGPIASGPAPKMGHASPTPGPIASGPAPEMGHTPPAPRPIAPGPAPEMGHVSPVPGPIAPGPAPEMGHVSPAPGPIAPGPVPGPIAPGPAPEIGHVSPAPGLIAPSPAPEMGHVSPASGPPAPSPGLSVPPNASSPLSSPGGTSVSPNVTSPPPPSRSIGEAITPSVIVLISGVIFVLNLIAAP